MDDNISLRSRPSSVRLKPNEAIRLDTNVAEVGPALSPPEARKIYIKTIVGGTVMLIVTIFTIFSIYWGALYRTSTQTHKMIGWVVDFDHGPVGKAVISAVQELPHSLTAMTWVVKDASEFPGGPQDLAKSVHDQHVWLGVSVNPDVSTILAAALESPLLYTNYSGSFAVTGYAEEARSENGFRAVIRPQFDALMQPIVGQFAAQFIAQNVSTLPQAEATIIMRDLPRLVARPIDYTLNNQRAFDVPVATAVTYVGLIFLLMLSFVITMTSTGGREASGYEKSLSTGKLIALRFATSVTVYFFIALFSCLLSVAFQAPFNRHFGKSGFVIYWMLQWVGMLALGLALETMATLMGSKVILFVMLWIISEVAICFLPLEMLPGVYHYGYAMPFYNISQGVRVILFGTKNLLGLYFGVLFAWAGVSIITLPLSIIFVRWLQSRSAAKSAATPQIHPSLLEPELEPPNRRIRHFDSDATFGNREPFNNQK